MTQLSIQGFILVEKKKLNFELCFAIEINLANEKRKSVDKKKKKITYQLKKEGKRFVIYTIF